MASKKTGIFFAMSGGYLLVGSYDGRIVWQSDISLHGVLG
jgi:hypothetical protein